MLEKPVEAWSLESGQTMDAAVDCVPALSVYVRSGPAQGIQISAAKVHGKGRCLNMTMLVLLFFVPVLVAILLGLNLLLAAHRPDYEKVSVYECGFPVLTAQTRNPFSISFYLVAVLFLIFDLEIALIYPVAVSLGVITSYGF